MTDTAVGFVGLGNMGFPMAERLLAAGYAVRGYDTDPDVRKRFAGAGGTAVGSVTEAASADAVILMLPNSAIVASVLLEDGLLDAMAPGSVLIDMSSSEPVRTRELSAAAAERGVP